LFCKSAGLSSQNLHIKLPRSEQAISRCRGSSRVGGECYNKIMGSTGASTKHADVYRLFLRLGPGERRSVALRILRDEEVLADLYDHFLIREAVEERGRSVAWKSYRRKQAISTR